MSVSAVPSAGAGGPSAATNIARMPKAHAQARRANSRGLATREGMVEAALRSLAFGEPGAAPADRVA
ncbi:hypothetical protein MLAC_17080 [Mycobacterium lacus]|uniref:TetR family transcriptional regulator n=1 Tax=Mycobacterium lacus TaxID=169765 RepID=A0A7I7NIL5_9MYCO|nr:hypothetical protein MLAC_17080 [Mycobacterium lacus]